MTGSISSSGIPPPPAVAGASLEWHCGQRRPPIADRPLIMGILNVTPDSFSDGGRFADPETAVAHGLRMFQDGADIIDIGGESSRPGAQPVSADEETARTQPVIRELARRTDVLISIDTAKAPVAAGALEAGAHIINDISALTADQAMIGVARSSGAGVILMHMRGQPANMQHNPTYDDVVSEVLAYLRERRDAVTAAGIAETALALDPGIGFGKTTAHNLQLLRRLPEFAAIGRPLLIGLSRKRFLGEITGRDIQERQAATTAALTWAILAGARILRVHDVAAAADALRVVQSLREAPEPT
ncbi:MAG: dihydropteroate synthase [Kiritimatiellia bacterium]|nr:dihydropteroate synthase [Lentisphaerota bacterium]